MRSEEAPMTKGPQKYWTVNQRTSNDTILTVDDPNGWFTAWTSSDGCVHLHRVHNVPLPIDEENDQQIVDYLHICDLDAMIERLQALKATALEHFGGYWPE